MYTNTCTLNLHVSSNFKFNCFIARLKILNSTSMTHHYILTAAKFLQSCIAIFYYYSYYYFLLKTFTTEINIALSSFIGMSATFATIACYFKVSKVLLVVKMSKH